MHSGHVSFLCTTRLCGVLRVVRYNYKFPGAFSAAGFIFAGLNHRRNGMSLVGGQCYGRAHAREYERENVHNTASEI